MKIACTADLHGFLPSIASIPECDVLAIAGDVCPVWDHNRQVQSMWLRTDFTTWLEQVPARVVGIAGNHDFVAAANSRIMRDLPWTYLQDEGTCIDDVFFWGTPWATRFGNWAFMLDDDDLAERYAPIGHVDVLLTHGPPYGVGDAVRYTREGEDGHVGSRALADVIARRDIPLVVTGHIHEAAGLYALRRTQVVNASYVTFEYQPGNDIPVMEVDA